MRMLKPVLALVLLLALCVSAAAFAEDDMLIYQVGDTIADFTVTTYDGQTVTLSEVLQEKEAVLINIWATWCGPCRNEFPYMEEAYKEYADRVEVIALSCEETDTADVLSDFAAELGLTFKIAQDTVDMAAQFEVVGIPTSIMVDRFGTICFVETGSMPDADSFRRLFDAFLGEDYTESVLLDGVPKPLSAVAAPDPAELAAALNVEGGTLTFTSSDDPYVWPMVIGETDGRTVAFSSNIGVHGTVASVSTTVTAKAGDAIAVTLKISSENGCDLMLMSVNGETVKAFGGEDDWLTYAWAVPADGDYEVTISYAKDNMESLGADTLWVDSLALLSGKEAAAAIAATPAYPIADELSLRVVNETARQIVINDPTGTIASYFGDLMYLVPDEEVCFEIALPAGIDPEAALAYFDYDGSSYVLSDILSDGKYIAFCGCDTVQESGYSYSTLYLYPTHGNYEDVICLLYFHDEENVNSFVAETTSDAEGNVLGSWMYADGTAPSTDALATADWEVSYASDYVVKYTDQDGNPVEGVMCQVCDDSTCQVIVSDADGICAFTLPPYPWQIHTLRLPEGYEGDTEAVIIMPEEGGSVDITLTKQ